MTRTANGIVSIACLVSGALMIHYALTADVADAEVQVVATVPATAMEYRPLAERPMAIGAPAAARAAFEQAARLAFAPKRAR
jgi:hypothetical protein